MPRVIQFKTENGKKHTILDFSIDCVCGICKTDFSGTGEIGGAIFDETLTCKRCSIAIIKVRKKRPELVCGKEELFTKFALRNAAPIGESIAEIIAKNGRIVECDDGEFPEITKEHLCGREYETFDISNVDEGALEEGPLGYEEKEWDPSSGWGDEDCEGEEWKHGNQGREWSED